MRIEHVALWAQDLERMKEFYVRYFGAKVGARYENPSNRFESYFLSLEEGARMEIMKKTTNDRHPGDTERNIAGYSHLAISVGSREEVLRLTEWLRSEGIPVVSEPRMTGDGYFESVVLDPDGNRLEITI